MESGETLTRDGIAMYRSYIGALLYYVQDWEDRQFEIAVLGCQLKRPTDVALAALKRVAKYLIGTRDASVVLNRPPAEDPGR
eukprot:12349134-Heterocapsa_arctica.AAC.1